MADDIFGLSGAQWETGADALGVMSTLFSTFNSYVNNMSRAAIAKNNVKVAQENIKGIRSEESLNTAFTRMAAKRKIDAGNAAMAASGNIGTSADAVTYDGLNSLDSDLSTLRFNYDSRVTEQRNRINQSKYEERMYRSNAKKALIGGAITAAAGVTASLATGGLSQLLGAGAKTVTAE